MQHFKILNKVQKTALDRAMDFLWSNNKCLIVMATGTGKTMVGAKIIKEHKNQKILWLTQTDELVYQTRKDLQAIFGEESVGLYKAKVKNLSERIIVASVQTLSIEKNLLTVHKNLFDLMVVDEAHHAGARTWAKTIDYFNCFKLGLTATPYRNDGRGISEFFGEAAFNLSYEEAKELKIIASEIYRVILTNSKLEGVITKRGDYAPSDIDRLVVSKDRNEIIVKSYLKYGRTLMKKEGLPYKTICFCASVFHAEIMNNLFRKNGIKSEMLIGVTYTGGAVYSKEVESRLQMKAKRKEIYESFLSGNFEVLCVVNILNEGKNIPDVGCLLMTRPTRSRIIFQQQIGRGCRRIEGKKEKFIVLDYVDMMNQKYPPLTCAKVLNKQYQQDEIIFDYYKGKDPVIVDHLINYLSPTFNYISEEKWNKALVSKVLSEFFKKNKRISFQDLVPSKTGLPARRTIQRFWPSLKKCFDELGIPHLELKRWSKEECIEKVKEFVKKNGKITSLDLGRKNNLPSQKQIYTHWGTWNKFAVSLKFKKEPTTFLKPKTKRITTNPYRWVWAENKFRNRVGWRSNFTHNGKLYTVGTFKTAEAARDAVLKKRKELGLSINR